MTDTSTCWYNQYVVDEMNRFYDKHIKNFDITKHLSAFTQLLTLSETTGTRILDIGCGTAMLSDFCKSHIYMGCDLPHVLSGCSMRNYPQYWYRSSDIVADDLSWINEFDICVVNGVIDVMEDHVGVLSKILTHCKEYLIIHRQEITENGTTHTITNGSYGGKTYHSIFNRSDFNEILDKHNFDIIKEIPLEFANWENGGSSFLLRKRRSYALYGMDYKLNDLFDRKESGVFIECGANDGVRQSNTLFLERYKNWSGILIEPVTQQFNWCRENRSSVNHFVNCALVSNEYNSPFADILYTPECYGLMTVVNDERGRKRMVDVGEYHEAQKVPAKTLSTVMNEAGITHADLFVLDVEGYELDVLKGCDFDKYKIDYLLIEELGGGTAIMDYLSPWYTRVSNLSVHDILYKRIC